MSKIFDAITLPVNRLARLTGGALPETARTTYGQLDSGAQIMTRTAPGQPFVHIYASIQGAGSGLETYLGLPDGVAHYLEHMCCAGSQNYGVGEVAQRVQKDGGLWEAMTHLDWMDFMMHVVAKKWREGIDMFADSLCRPNLDPLYVSGEKKYVAGEDLTYEMNIPYSAFSQRSRKFSYGDHPHFHQILGTKESIASISQESLRAFHQASFVAEQTRIVVQGDVRHKDVVNAFNKSRFSLFKRVEPAKPQGFPLTFHGGDFRVPTAEKGTRLAVLFPMQDHSHYEGAVRANVLTNILYNELFPPLRKASGPYDLGTWMFNERCATHMALSCTVYPEYVKDTLLIMGHGLTKMACDGAADKLADRQRVDNTNWKSRSLPSWRDTQGLLSAWARFGFIPSEKEAHHIIQSIKPADIAAMAQGMLAGPVGVCMEGNLKGLPSRAEVPLLLGVKGALSSQP